MQKGNCSVYRTNLLRVVHRGLRLTTEPCISVRYCKASLAETFGAM